MIQSKPKKNHFHNDDELAIVTMKEQANLDFHTHKYHELVVVRAGSGTHVTESESYTVGAGDVFIMRPGAPHSYRNTEALDLINVLYWPKRLPMGLADMRQLPGFHALFELEPQLRQQQGFSARLQLEPAALTHTLSLIDKINEELKQRKPGYRAIAISTFLTLVAELSRSYGAVRTTSAEDMMRFGTLLSHLETDYHKALSLKQMAAMASMSASSLNRLFQRVHGVSPARYLLNLRLKRAAELLKNSEQRITEIALHCGFNDSNYFTRQFRSFKGFSPRNYRVQMQGL